jgi:hypothetical protein
VRFRLPHPNKSADLAPVKVNMPAVFLIGTGMWLVGTAVVALWLAIGEGAKPGWLAIGGAGALMGLVGWAWSRWRRW